MTPLMIFLGIVALIIIICVIAYYCPEAFFWLFIFGDWS